jgi:hypothetical protein
MGAGVRKILDHDPTGDVPGSSYGVSLLPQWCLIIMHKTHHMSAVVFLALGLRADHEEKR